eukprot:CAMPEP_0179160842 /NCGR_PEP_ID=MMETSP0796-20121207/78681_1 /TAXON_ID=73915 /ORGANISM="Pyrodinium bahamense, Strain pbaha01" /LENGTH=44 /DNA_ID= /DNA_START= /DNA_END= /DNA_ORIENTATION=
MSSDLPSAPSVTALDWSRIHAAITRAAIGLAARAGEAVESRGLF